MATPRQKGAFLLFLVPMFALLSPLLGGMTVAIDSTAGERERGSLEPLLGNPVPIRDVVGGKWLAAWAFAAGVAILTLAGFLAAASLYTDRRVAALLVFGVPEFLASVAMVVPFAAMTSALQMVICTYGRSYREAQTYVSYLATAVSFVPVIALFTGLKESAWQFAVPVLGQLAALSRVVRGEELRPLDWLLPSAVAALVAAGAVLLVSRLLADERIVFGRA
jgi:sodium transport system permease protein